MIKNMKQLQYEFAIAQNKNSVEGWDYFYKESQKYQFERAKRFYKNGDSIKEISMKTGLNINFLNNKLILGECFQETIQ